MPYDKVLAVTEAIVRGYPSEIDRHPTGLEAVRQLEREGDAGDPDATGYRRLRRQPWRR